MPSERRTGGGPDGALTIAIIGAAGHFGYVFEGLKAGVDGVIACFAPGGPDEDMAPVAAAAAHCAPRSHADWRTMIDREKPEVAVVNPRFDRTAGITAACLERGIHVFAEKPLALTPAGLELVRVGLARGGAHLAAMHPYRYDPSFNAAFTAVQAGRTGDLLLLAAQKSYKLGTRAGWWHDRSTYGGTIPWVGAHAVDWLHWFSGGRLATVAAAHSPRGNRGHGTLEMAATCLFTLKGGGQATATIDYCRPAAAATHGDDRLRVAGTDGVVEVMGGTARLITAGDSGVELSPEPAPGTLFGDFIAQVRGAGDCRVTAADSLEVTRICLATREAADTGRLMTL
ncbi:MAG: Gfo/Idh/MocA family oxidoreductase [Planctomycetota bacterium]